MDACTTDNGPWNKLTGLRPVELKNSGCQGKKTLKKLKSLKIFLLETIRLRASKFGMYLYLMGLYQASPN